MMKLEIYGVVSANSEEIRNIGKSIMGSPFPVFFSSGTFYSLLNFVVECLVV